MKKLKTWEMIKELSENFNSEHFKYVRELDGLEIEVDNRGYLLWEGGHQYLNINHLWRKVSTPVDFLEAYEVWYRNRKNILCVTKEGERIYYRDGDTKKSIKLEHTIYGKWYIL